MESLLDGVFVLGAAGALLVLPLALTAVWSSRASLRYSLLTTGLGVVVAWLCVGHGVVWWFAFDWVSGESVPNGLFPVTTVLMTASALGCVLLLLAGVAPWVVRRPAPPPTL